MAADAIGKGGVSGRVLHRRSLAAIKAAYVATGGRLPIIGVGGTDSAEARELFVRKRGYFCLTVLLGESEKMRVVSLQPT